MGKASAIPDHLYKYSDHTTQAAQSLQDWVRTVLAPALKAYQSGAAPGTSGANVDTGAVAARADSVHIELPKQIAKAFYTDRDVRQTGNAFLRAGSEGKAAFPFAPILDFRPLAEQVIQTTDEKVGGASWRAGALAADNLGTDPAATLKLLKANIDDHDFTDGFVDSLTPEQLKFLMKLVFSKDGYNLPSMTGLRDPSSGYSGYSYVVPGEFEGLVQPYQKVLFSALTNGIQSMSPARAKQLLGDVGDGMPKMSPEQFAGIRPDLTAFLTAGARQVVSSLPPKAPGQSNQEYWNDIATKWATDSGKDLAVLQKYADWIERIADPGSERGTGLGVTIVLEVVAGALLIPVPEVGLPLELALHGAAGATVYTVEGLVTPALFESMHPQIEQLAEELGLEVPKGEHPTPEQLGDRMKVILQQNARLTLALKAYQAGVVIPSADGVDIATAIRNGNLAPLAEKLRDEDTDWLSHQTIKNGGNLENLIAEIRNQWDAPEPSHD